MNNSNKSEGNENITVNENNKQLDKKNKNFKKWCTANIILFFISIILFNVGINVFQFLFNADEYTIGLGMIFGGLPIIVFLFGMFVMGLGIIAFVFEIVSIIEILAEEVNKIFKIIIILEICGYIAFYLFKVI